MKLYLLYLCEPFKESSLIGIYTSEEKAKIRESELNDTINKLKSRDFRLNVYLKIVENETDIFEKNNLETWLDFICVDNKPHAYLGNTCTICNHNLESK